MDLHNFHNYRTMYFIYGLTWYLYMSTDKEDISFYSCNKSLFYILKISYYRQMFFFSIFIHQQCNNNYTNINYENIFSLRYVCNINLKDIHKNIRFCYIRTFCDHMHSYYKSNVDIIVDLHLNRIHLNMSA